MDNIEFDKYTEAVDLVCLYCTAPTLDCPEVMYKVRLPNNQIIDAFEDELAER